MKTVTHTDDAGRKLRYGIPSDADSDFNPSDGLYLGPPLLDVDWEAIGVQVYNGLSEAKVDTQEDVTARDGVLTAVVKRIVVRELLNKYLEATTNG